MNTDTNSGTVNNGTVNGTHPERRILPATATPPEQPVQQAVDIRPGDTWDVHIVALLIARAFHDLAVARWLVPDSVQRRSVLYHYFLIHAEHGLRHGHVYIATGGSGLAQRRR